MDLIIVRHGKAEDISQKPEGSDFNRSLTDEGVVQVRTRAKILKGITTYSEYKNIRIVASSSERTMQSANNISDIMKTAEAIPYDSLYHGDYNALIPDIVSEHAEAE